MGPGVFCGHPPPPPPSPAHVHGTAAAAAADAAAATRLKIRTLDTFFFVFFPTVGLLHKSARRQQASDLAANQTGPPVARPVRHPATAAPELLN